MVKESIESELKRIIADDLGLAPREGLLSRGEGAFDYASPAALMYAKEAGKSPKELAEAIKDALGKSTHVAHLIDKVEVAGPGFVNIMLSEEGVLESLSSTRDAIEGGLTALEGEKINIEFISANPTGALHLGHGRGAFFGDTLARVMRFAGADVTSEFYINDSRESNQIVELGKTALGKGEQYKTSKLEVLMESCDFSGLDESEAGFLLGEKVQEENKKFIEDKLRITFNEWYSEDAHIRATGAADNMLKKLKDFTYEKDGAVWLKTSEYGDDEDRVVVRSDGNKSYFLADIAYHNEKFARGFTQVIDVWGADHHGHVKRMRAVGKMLGWPNIPEQQPIIFISQLVRLKEGGESKKMSKRAGNVILLEDMIDEYGTDVVRWFFGEKALGTHMDFDADLAREQSAKNPVFYVQYAHARICSIAASAAVLTANADTLADVTKTEAGRALATKITEFPELTLEIAGNYQVHKLTTYLHELAHAFSGFYRDVRVIEGETYYAGALELAHITRETLTKGLDLLGISAPEKM